MEAIIKINGVDAEGKPVFAGIFAALVMAALEKGPVEEFLRRELELYGTDLTWDLTKLEFIVVEGTVL